MLCTWQYAANEGNVQSCSVNMKLSNFINIHLKSKFIHNLQCCEKNILYRENINCKYIQLVWSINISKHSTGLECMSMIISWHTYVAAELAYHSAAEREQGILSDRYFEGHPKLAGCQNLPMTGYPPGKIHQPHYRYSTTGLRSRMLSQYWECSAATVSLKCNADRKLLLTLSNPETGHTIKNKIMPLYSVQGVRRRERQPKWLIDSIIGWSGVNPAGSMKMSQDVTLHWLPVSQRITFKIALMTYVCIHGRSPVYFRDICSPIVSVPFCSRFSSADNDDIIVPRTRTTHYGPRSFHVAAPHVTTSSQEQ